MHRVRKRGVSRSSQPDRAGTLPRACLETREIDAPEDAATDLRGRLLLLLFCLSYRAGEVLGLTDDIDFAHDMVRIQQKK
jgi:hypothetical protein